MQPMQPMQQMQQMQQMQHMPMQQMPMQMSQQRAMMSHQPMLEQGLQLHQLQGNHPHAGQGAQILPRPHQQAGQGQSFQPGKRSHGAASTAHGLQLVQLQGSALLDTATDKWGSRQLQEALTSMGDAQQARVCDELAPQLLLLAKHPVGNYVASTMASLPHSHAAFVAAVRGHAVELLNHPQGSRVVQALIAHLPAADVKALVAEIEPETYRCSLDTHGSWGVCAAYKATHAPPILAAVSARLQELSVSANGCRVAQRVLQEAASAGVDIGAAVKTLLASELGTLAKDPYANYALQVAMRACAAHDRRELVDRLLPDFMRIATHKHGSNVAEALLLNSNAAQLATVATLLFGPPGAAAPPPAPTALGRLLADKFGYFVLQELLRRLTVERRAEALRHVHALTTERNHGRAITAAFAEPGPGH
mmetsp:Transcript_38414/g.65921  ORF Transcript_38414/g.65921 Transcript_38414/m.65921 type:complete len:422 (+) Transcript_38414:2-1267(+)